MPSQALLIRRCGLFVAFFAALTCPFALARDWFVAADAKDGDGSRLKPYRDAWMALRDAEAGDAIHIAAGIYFGRYDRSCWEVDRPRVTILGGYSRDFSRRTPWQTPSVFSVFREYEGGRDPNLIVGKGEHAGLVLDGLVFDASGRSVYGDTPLSALRRGAIADGPIAVFYSPEVVIRNCVFANSASGAVQLSGEGSRFENNVVANILGPGMLTLRDYASGNKRPMAIRSNTFAFAHDSGSPPLGRGADSGTGIRTYCAASIEDNVFVACANYAICVFARPESVAVNRNVFWMSPHAHVAKQLTVNRAEISDKNMEEIEDLGLASAKGNTIVDPGLSGLRPDWLDAVTRHMLISYASPPRAAIAAARAAANLPMFTPSPPKEPAPKDRATSDRDSRNKPPAPPADDASAGALAPYMDMTDCLALRVRMPDRGAHLVELRAQYAPQEPTPAAVEYRPVKWEQFVSGDPSWANKRIELRAGLDGERSWFILNDVAEASHFGFSIMDADRGQGLFIVYAKRGSRVQRQYDEGAKCTTPREIQEAYLVRGICRLDTGNARQKATMIVESIIAAPPIPVALPKRPPGRDWFVRAGATGGDGSRGQPFRDPFQALEKASPRDVIHVAGGDYFGKLRSGNWKVLGRDLTMLGGYNSGFTARDPWKNPTRLVLAGDLKGRHTGTFLESTDSSDGLVLDGFVFDGSTVNSYLPTGTLDLTKTVPSSMVVLRAGSGTVAVRNCTFVNACGCAITIRAAAGAFENNIVLNSSGWAVEIETDGPNRFAIRHNTLLFAWDKSAGAARGVPGTDGTLLLIGRRGKAEIERNVFGFADRCGIRCVLAPGNVTLNDNAFVANLHSHVTDTRYFWAHTATWERRATMDWGCASVRGNSLEALAPQIDKAYADRAFTRLFTLPSRYSADDWSRIALAVGATVSPRPPAVTSATQPTTKPLKSDRDRSLEDLLAELKRQTDTPPIPAAAPAGPSYCPAYEWRKALDLVRDADTGAAGARWIKLGVLFTATP